MLGYDEFADAFSEEFAASAAELGIPGAAVGAVYQGTRQIVTVGRTAFGGEMPITESTLFQIGSTAKTFTAVLVMVLVDQGRLTLDEPVRDKLPQLAWPADASAAVTVRQLLNHTAGWEGGDSWPDTGEGDDAVARAAALIADLPYRFDPGTDASYNNFAFVLAGRLAEVVTGEPFEHALARLVLDPIGLHHTRSTLNQIMTHTFALGHELREGADPRVVRPWSDPRGYLPAGARLSCSIEDLTDWAHLQLGDGRAANGHRLLGEQSLQAMHRSSTTHQLIPGVGIGIGWMLRDLATVDGPLRLIEHHGDVAGQHSTITVAADHELAIAVLANAGPPGHALADGVVRSFLRKRIGVSEVAPARRSATTAELSAYAGTYRGAGIVLQVIADGSALVIHGTLHDDGESGETLAFPVELLADDQFVVAAGPFDGMRGAFVRDNKRVTAVRHMGRTVARVANAKSSSHTD